MMLMTPRLLMEPPDMSDAGLFADWLNDPEIVKYSEQRHRKHTAESQRDYWRSSATVEPNLVYTIHKQGPEGPVGSIAARIDQGNNVANVGIMIDKTQWGAGLGPEAWDCVCNYLFIEKKIRKIEAGCMALNAPMIRICVKYGMRLEAVVPDHFLIDGKPVAMHLYGSIGER